MIVLLDNYDSFVHNLARYVRELGGTPEVVRNDAASVDDIAALAPTHVIVSPGPCTPAEAGISVEVIRRLGPTTPVLGVCLGHQAIAHVHGGRVERAPRVVHGQASRVYHDGRSLYAGVSNPMQAGRYHSLVVDERDLPAELEIAAYTSDGEIMGLRVAGTRTEGVQFHPESILTADGPRLIANFLRGSP